MKGIFFALRHFLQNSKLISNILNIGYYMRNIFSFFLPILIITNFASAQSYKILESNSDRIKIEVDFRGVYQVKDTTINSRVYQMIKGGESAVRMPGEPWLPEYSFNLAIPLNSEPTLKITGSEKFVPCK